jgi:hypothetical protein
LVIKILKLVGKLMENEELSFIEYSNWNMFIYQEIEMNEIDPNLGNRRREFVKDIRTRNNFGISLGCMKNILMIVFFIILAIIFLYFYTHGYIGV